jgi:hypothetical protein
MTKEEKRLYDIEYRRKNKERIKERQKKYNESPAGRATQKRQREKRKKYHADYIKSDRYRKWKKEYDKNYRSRKEYGEFWECFIILIQIYKLIPNREVKQQLSLNNKSIKRKRNYEKLKCKEFKGYSLGNLK